MDAFDILKYVMLLFGIAGIGLGAYGLFGQRLRDSVSITLPRFRIVDDADPDDADEDLEAWPDELAAASPARVPQASAAATPVAVRVPLLDVRGQRAAMPTVATPAPAAAAITTQAEDEAEESELEAEDEELEQEEQAEEALPELDLTGLSDVGLDAELMEIFGEAAQAKRAPDAVLDLLQEVPIDELVKDAREVRALIRGQRH
jgi:hypothetical protein